MGGIGFEAINHLGDNGVTHSHDHWDLLDEYGNVDQGLCGARAVLCKHTLAAILGKGGRSEDDGVKLNQPVHYKHSKWHLSEMKDPKSTLRIPSTLDLHESPGKQGLMARPTSPQDSSRSELARFSLDADERTKNLQSLRLIHAGKEI